MTKMTPELRKAFERMADNIEAVHADLDQLERAGDRLDSLIEKLRAEIRDDK